MKRETESRYGRQCGLTQREKIVVRMTRERARKGIDGYLCEAWVGREKLSKGMRERISQGGKDVYID